MSPRPPAAVAAALLAMAAAAALVGPAQGAAGATVVDYAVTVDGEVARGRLALPASGSPVALVLVCHGYGGTAAAYDARLLDLASRGHAAAAMDYRGDRTAWKVWAGWRDTVAATLDLQARFPAVQRTIVWGHSMGGEVSGLAVAHAPAGTYDYWVSDAGVLDLFTEWAWWPLFQGVIEAEAGGGPRDATPAYHERSPVHLGPRFAAAGLTRAFLTHDAGDRLVPSSMMEQMTHTLAAAGVPVSAYLSPEEAHRNRGYPIVLEKAAGMPDWAQPLLRGKVVGESYQPPPGPPPGALPVPLAQSSLSVP